MQFGIPLKEDSYINVDNMIWLIFYVVCCSFRYRFYDSVLLTLSSWFQNEPHFYGTNCYWICGMIATRSYRWISGNLSNKLSGPLAKQDSRVDMFQVFYWKTHLHLETPDLGYHIWQNCTEMEVFKRCVSFKPVGIIDPAVFDFSGYATWASRRYGWEAYEPLTTSTGHDKVAAYTATKQPQLLACDAFSSHFFTCPTVEVRL